MLLGDERSRAFWGDALLSDLAKDDALAAVPAREDLSEDAQAMLARTTSITRVLREYNAAQQVEWAAPSFARQHQQNREMEMLRLDAVKLSEAEKWLLCAAAVQCLPGSAAVRRWQLEGGLSRSWLSIYSLP